jgi:hypothetical protein
MNDEIKRVKVENFPITQNGGLKVELVPMPSGDNPWRTQGDYRKEQRRDTIRFWIMIASLVVAIISVAATAMIAIATIRNIGQQNVRSMTTDSKP